MSAGNVFRYNSHAAKDRRSRQCEPYGLLLGERQPAADRSIIGETAGAAESEFDCVPQFWVAVPKDEFAAVFPRSPFALDRSRLLAFTLGCLAVVREIGVDFPAQNYGRGSKRMVRYVYLVTESTAHETVDLQLDSLLDNFVTALVTFRLRPGLLPGRRTRKEVRDRRVAVDRIRGDQTQRGAIDRNSQPGEKSGLTVVKALRALSDERLVTSYHDRVAKIGHDFRRAQPERVRARHCQVPINSREKPPRAIIDCLGDFGKYPR